MSERNWPKATPEPEHREKPLLDVSGLLDAINAENHRLRDINAELLAALKYLLELGGDDDRRIAAETAIAKAAQS